MVIIVQSAVVGATNNVELIMKTQVRDTSIEAYHGEIVGTKEDRQARIVAECVKKLGTCTRRMVAKELGMETGTVSARVNKLIKDFALHETDFRKPCPITGVSVRWIEYSGVKDGSL